MNEEIRLADKFEEQTIICDNCNKKLLNYAIKAPDEPVVHSMVITCPFCNSDTDCISIHGLISWGPIGSEQSAYPTVILDADTDEQNIWRVKLGKK